MHNSNHLKIFVIVVAMPLFLIGCNSWVTDKVEESIIQKKEETWNTEDESVDSARYEIKGGTFMTGRYAPEEWPKDISKFADMRVLSAMIYDGTERSGKKFTGEIKGEQKNIFAYYRDKLPQDGWTVDDVQSDWRIVTATKGSRTFSLNIESCRGAPDISFCYFTLDIQGNE